MPSVPAFENHPPREGPYFNLSLLVNNYILLQRKKFNNLHLAFVIDLTFNILQTID